MIKPRFTNFPDSDSEKLKRFSRMTLSHIREELDAITVPYPNYFYKYIRSDIRYDRLSCLLIDSDFYLNSRVDFNDPFDSTANIQLNDSKKELRKKFETLIKSGLKNSNQNMDKWEIQNKVSELMEKNQNTPYFLDDFMVNAVNEIGIYCLSENNASILMWSHFANNHNGLVLEFEVAETIDTFLGISKIIYSEKYPTLKFMNQKDNDHYNLVTTKSKDWEYEKEWRIIKPYGAKKYLAFKPSALRSLTFGCKADETVRKLVSELLEKRAELGLPKITIKQARMHEK